MVRRPKQARAEQRRQSLLDAAATLLARDGYAGVTTNAIAKEARAAVGTVYDYFPNKEALLGALLDRYRVRLEAAVMPKLLAAGPDASLEALVEQGVRAFASFYQDEPGYAELWLGSQMESPLREAGQQWGEEFAGLLAQLVAVRTGVSTIRATRAATTLVHAMSAVVTLALTKAPIERDGLIDETVVLCQGYLRALSTLTPSLHEAD